MRSLLVLLAAAAALASGAAGCGNGPARAGDSEPSPTAVAGSTPVAGPTSTSTPGPAGDGTPPPQFESSAVSLDTQAKLTAREALKLVDACFARTAGRGPCNSADGSITERHTSVVWGTGPGEISVRSSGSAFTLDAVSTADSRSHFLIVRDAGGHVTRPCRRSVSECDGGTW